MIVSPKSVLAGVDASPAGVRAAVTAWDLAERVGASCRLVHAVRDPGDLYVTPDVELPPAFWSQHLAGDARNAVADILRTRLPPAALECFEVRLGSPPWVLLTALGEYRADVLVLGAKAHAAPVRWLGGSTIHSAVRIVNVPMLVAVGEPCVPRRILVAVDLFEASEPTLQAAAVYARALDAELVLMHVVEPWPVGLSAPAFQAAQDEQWQHVDEALHALAASVPTRRPVTPLIKTGEPAEVILEAAEELHAELVVIGSHGKNWLDRVLIGSTTERLLNRTPSCSVLVIPVPKPERAKTPSATKAHHPAATT